MDASAAPPSGRGGTAVGGRHSYRSPRSTPTSPCWSANPRRWPSTAAVSPGCPTGSSRGDHAAELPAELPTGGATPRRPYGHPDLILGRAVAAGVITAAQAELIGAARLGDVLVEQIAAEHGVPAPVIRMRRKRAERSLVRALAHGDLPGRR